MLAAMTALIAIGVLTIYAAGNPDPALSLGKPYVPPSAWQKQLIFAAAGLLAIIAINAIPYRVLGPASYWIYPAVLVILAFLLTDRILDTPIVETRDAKRWIRIIPGYDVKIQPSEFCKIAYILAIAWYLRFRHNYYRFRGLVGPFAITILAMVLILMEPDLGTVLLFMPILFSMLYVAGAKVRNLLLIICIGLAVSPLVAMKLRPYQRKRLSGLFLQNAWILEKAQNNPRFAKILGVDSSELSKWTTGKGYQLEHSKRAIGSGGLRGYGFRKGPYLTKNDPKLPVHYTLPEMHNDLIFAIIAHQCGFIGCLIVLALYGIIMICATEIASYNTDPFARLIAVGIMAMFAVEVIVNVSITMGLMPITGLTLPFISYGGSSLVVSMMGIGLLNSIGRYRPFTVAPKGLERIIPVPRFARV